MSKETKLKPCPFCGNRVAVEENINFGEPNDFIVYCNPSNGGCGAKTRLCESEEEAIEAWNRRVNDEPIDGCDGCISGSCDSCVRNQHLCDYYERGETDGTNDH